jgi:hypothetical protein
MENWAMNIGHWSLSRALGYRLWSDEGGSGEMASVKCSMLNGLYGGAWVCQWDHDLGEHGHSNRIAFQGVPQWNRAWNYDTVVRADS